MKTFLAIFTLSVALGALTVPLVQRLALRVGAVSVPGGRHVHARVMPRLGGLAIYAAFFLPLVALFFVPSGIGAAFFVDRRRLVALVVGGTFLCLIGALDDWRGLRAKHKLAAQVAAATIAYFGGYRIDAVQLPVVGDLSMGIFSLPVTCVWIVGIVNAINLIDGLDGLAAGVAVFACLTNFFIAWHSGSTVLALMMASMLGACVGFLFYNFNPARIFLGDSGSYLIGFVLGVASLAGAQHKTSTAVSLLVPVVALGIPIFDTLFAMARRILERRPLFSPDRGHIHHRLLDMGFTHRRAVLALYGVCVALMVAAIAMYTHRSWQMGAALIAATVAFFGFARLIGSYQTANQLIRQNSRFRTSDVERLRRLLPQVVVRLQSADVDGLWRALDEFRVEAQFDQVVIRALSDEAAIVTLGQTTREPLVARFPLGDDHQATHVVDFHWRSDFGNVTPEADVLLQIVADLIAAELAALKSPLVPAAPHPPALKVVVGPEQRSPSVTKLAQQ